MTAPLYLRINGEGEKVHCKLKINKQTSGWENHLGVAENCLKRLGGEAHPKMASLIAIGKHEN